MRVLGKVSQLCRWGGLLVVCGFDACPLFVTGDLGAAGTCMQASLHAMAPRCLSVLGFVMFAWHCEVWLTYGLYLERGIKCGRCTVIGGCVTKHGRRALWLM